MSQHTQDDDDIAEAFRLLASRSPRPPDHAIQQIKQRSRRRRRAHVIGGGVATVAVVAAVTMVGSGFDGSMRPDSTPVAPAGSVAWQDLYGPELAAALGLEPVPLPDVDDTAACDAKIVAEFEEDMTYCFLPSDYGITDPVEADMLTWQLQGVPPSPTLTQIAQLEVDERALANTQSPSSEDAQRINELKKQIEQLKAQVLPQDW
jgi:hypothetical protein